MGTNNHTEQKAVTPQEELVTQTQEKMKEIIDEIMREIKTALENDAGLLAGSQYEGIDKKLTQHLQDAQHMLEGVNGAQFSDVILTGGGLGGPRSPQSMAPRVERIQKNWIQFRISSENKLRAVAEALSIIQDAGIGSHLVPRDLPLGYIYEKFSQQASQIERTLQWCHMDLSRMAAMEIPPQAPDASNALEELLGLSEEQTPTVQPTAEQAPLAQPTVESAEPDPDDDRSPGN